MLDGKSKPPAVKLVTETPSGAMRVTLPDRFVPPPRVTREVNRYSGRVGGRAGSIPAGWRQSGADRGEFASTVRCA
jgi:hypothetical protein